ncbi:MAG: c-type cytochrome [Bacteroidetes bacterium]|jgi:cytochrome c oxidase cbb3-type subunit 3|nr:c-type cytochrome [Bacteroidota bacterium]
MALFLPLSEARAEGAGDIAVLITGVSTVVIMMLLLFIVFVMNADVAPMTRLLATLRNRFWTGAYTEQKIGVDHDFDGITELDNRIPPWFNYLFYGSVVFGIGYFIHFHVLGGTLSAGEYEQQMAAAAIERRVVLANEGSIDENNIAVLTAADALANGEGNYQKYCVSCHAKDGGGIVGPNLTDQYWIHGGGVKDVYGIIKNGVAAKGMISWQLVFTPKQMQELASYVLTLQGTKPLAPKKAEGELFVVKADSLKK